MTRFYVSARFGRQAEAREAAEEITRLTGWECTARWLDATTVEDDAAHSNPALMRDVAAQDLADIDAADIMFCLTEDLSPPPSHRWQLDVEHKPFPEFVPVGFARGGRHVEVGYAIARGRNIVLIGPRENIFHGFAGVHETVIDAVESIELDRWWRNRDGES